MTESSKMLLQRLVKALANRSLTIVIFEFVEEALCPIVEQVNASIMK